MTRYSRRVNLQPLRITILGLHYAPEPTGNAPYTSSLARGLQELGYEVRVVTGHPHYPEWKIQPGYGEWRRRELIHNVRVDRLLHYVPRRPTAARRLLSELSFGVRLLFARWGDPDVVLLVSPALFSTMVAMGRARFGVSKPAVGVWVQDLYSRGVVQTGTGNGLAHGRMAAIEARTLKAATGVAVIHDRFKSVVTSHLGVDPDRVSVIRNWSHLRPVGQHDRGSERARLGWRDEDVIVLHAGNMGQKQGLENVVAAARLAVERQSRVRFVLMGDGNQRKSLEADAQGVGTVDFVDPLPGNEFQQALAAADILLVNERPGVKDMAVPSKLTSYFSAGVPVVAATDKGSVTASEIETSGGGIRVDAGDPKALLDALESLSSDPDRSRQLAGNGLKFRQVTLSKSNAIAHYDEFLTSLASARGR